MIPHWSTPRQRRTGRTIALPAGCRLCSPLTCSDDRQSMKDRQRPMRLDRDAAVAIAAQAVAFLAADDDRLGRFLALTGLSPTELKAGLGQPAFLGAVLDYLLSDEPLLLAFAETVDIAPEMPAAARRLLP